MNYNNNELYHSDRYLGADYSDGIRHFKYVYKKKGPNGKWIYYYDKKTGLNSSAMYIKTKGNNKSRYGTYERTNTTAGNHKDPSTTYRDIRTVKKGNSLFTKTRVNVSKKRGEDAKVYTTTEVGKIRQGADAAKAKVSKVAKKTLKSTKKAVSKGKKKIAKLINKKKKK